MIEPTADERREVAAKLRELDGWETETLSDTWYVEQLSKIVGYSDTGSMTERLADLIEPERTCRIVMVTDGEWGCEKCGGPIDWDSYDEDDPPNCNYCPNCGARVVSA